MSLVSANVNQKRSGFAPVLVLLIVLGVIALGGVGYLGVNQYIKNRVAEERTAQEAEKQKAEKEAETNAKVDALENQLAALMQAQEYPTSSEPVLVDQQEVQALKSQIATLKSQAPAQETNPKAAPITLDFVNPAIVISGFENVLTVHGSGFQDGAKVKLGDVELLSTSPAQPTVVNSQFLKSFLSGIYDITVTNPDGGSATLRQVFTVRAPAANSTNSQEALSTVEVVNKMRPSTVLIRTSDSCGSGVIIQRNGYVVTNYHVVSGHSTATVYLYNNTSYVGNVIGTDEAQDLALIKIQLDGLIVAEWGDASEPNLPLGSNVVALGYPLTCNSDMTLTIAQGTITSRRPHPDATYGSLGLLLQTSAVVHSGNSGGPLVNDRGRVVGINTLSWLPPRDGVNISGISFAIPSNVVQAKLSSLNFVPLNPISQSSSNYVQPTAATLTFTTLSPNGRHVVITGSGFCDFSPNSSIVMYTEEMIPVNNYVSWTPTRIEYTVPSKFQPATYIVKIRGWNLSTNSSCPDVIVGSAIVK